MHIFSEILPMFWIFLFVCDSWQNNSNNWFAFNLDWIKQEKKDKWKKGLINNNLSPSGIIAVMPQVIVLLILYLIKSVSTSFIGYHDAKTQQKCELQGYRLPIKVNGCLQTSVDINTCYGTCRSYDAPLQSDYSMKTSCPKCSVESYVVIIVQMQCFDSKKMFKNHYHSIRSATSCLCKSS